MQLGDLSGPVITCPLMSMGPPHSLKRKKKYLYGITKWEDPERRKEHIGDI